MVVMCAHSVRRWRALYVACVRYACDEYYKIRSYAVYLFINDIAGITLPPLSLAELIIINYIVNIMQNYNKNGNTIQDNKI